LFVAGVGHASAGDAMVERMFITDSALPAALAALRQAGIEQAIVLSTCDRVEVIGAATDPLAQGTRALALLAERAGMDGETINRLGHQASDEAALRHLFALAAGLESQVLGEPQILGQIKDAHRRASAASMIDRELETALQACYAAAKRVRSETEIGRRPVSLAQAAVQLARDVHGALGRSRCLMIGAGEMGELLVEQLRLAGVDRLSITAPSPVRAEEAARRLAGRVVPYEPLDAAIADCDIIVTAAGTGRYLLTRARVDAAQRARRHRPLFIIDAGVPADVEPAVEGLDGVIRYDLDDLERATMSGRASRSAATEPALRIIDDEIAAFQRAQAERAAVPAIIALRRHFEAARQQALRQAGGDATRATELLVNRLLHEPTSALRRAAGFDGLGIKRQEMERLLKLLFQLDESPTRPAIEPERRDGA
jgi:glutamyl-tRNA reductase